AITWFFEHEEMGIILEDDTVPSLSFFWFCEELLKRYKDDKRIAIISGNNFQDGIKRGDGDYYFSIYNHIWGWATWRDRWEGYDFELDSFKDDKFIEELFVNKKAIKYWKNIFWKMKRREIDSWAYPWTFHLWKKKQLSILPQVNLVSNIGFGEEGTHTKVKQKGISEIPVEEIDILNLKHPSRIERNEEADEYTFKKCCAPRPLWFRIIRKIRTYIGAR
ncbi:MAG: nucleotide-diphospho-sugar transferase, partial [Elusimicrobiota bacterium]|nr:nucleotide-diphospho-sugar transferase [Endomicrobiia bacterium]MDW8166533.1 nucleotide-diphospho-sugar transferase [Elusimicrobiota bacterium]